MMDSMPLSLPIILFESPEFLVLDKPAGWLSIPARVPEASHQVVSQWLGDRAPFVVHRLDRFTSGVMLFAKTKEAHQTANRWFLNREVKKTYHLLAAPAANTPMPSRPAIQVKTPVDGKPAQTLFEILKKGTSALYLKATPLTGRFHQIRAHAQEAGFPILGDKPHHGSPTFSAADGSLHTVPRVMLHAKSLTLPFGEFQAELPEDFARFVGLI